jgi:hypothetical protein
MGFNLAFKGLITLKMLSLRINTFIPLLFPLFKTVLELLQSDSLQCLRRFFPSPPLHSKKRSPLSSLFILGNRKKSQDAGLGEWEGGGCLAVVIPFFVRNCRTLTQCCVGESIVVMQKPFATIRGVFLTQHHAIV